MKIEKILLSCFAFGLVACQSGQQISETPAIGVRTAIQQENPISLKNDVQSIEYIPLETNDSCLVSNALNLQVSADFLFMYNGKTGQVLQFDRKGKFVRPVGRQGNGPGEYNLVSYLAANNKQKELTICQYGSPALVYSFDGTFLRSDSSLQAAGGLYDFPNGNQALQGLVMSPIDQAPWAGALKNTDGSLKATKSLYPETIQREKRFMKEISFSPSPTGVLLFTACNDTVFRITPTTIEPACVLKRENTPEYYAGIADITRLGDNTVETDEAIGVYDLFESPHYVYIRLYKGDGVYIQQYNKETGELKSHRIPDDYLQCSDAIPGSNVIGLENDLDGGLPFWPEYACYDGTRAQIASSYHISTLREKGYLKEAPADLNIGEDDNPVIILYTFK